MELTKQEMFMLRFMRSMNATDEQIVGLALLLDTEENIVKMNEWFADQGKAGKTPQVSEAIREATKIREAARLM